MANTGLHGVTESLQRGAQMANTVSTNIRGHQAALRPIVEELKGQWEGTARPAFDMAHANWEQGITRLVNALDHLGETTSYSSNTYDVADQNSQQAIAQVNGMSPFGGVLNA